MSRYWIEPGFVLGLGLFAYITHPIVVIYGEQSVDGLSRYHIAPLPAFRCTVYRRVGTSPRLYSLLRQVMAFLRKYNRYHLINAPFKGSQLTLPHLWNEKWRRRLGRQWYSEITIGEYDSDRTTYIEGDIIIWRRRCWCAIWYELVEHLYCIGYLAGSNFQGSPSTLIFEHGVSDDYDTQTF